MIIIKMLFIKINLNLLSALDYAINWAVVSLGLSVSVAFGQLRNCFSPQLAETKG